MCPGPVRVSPTLPGQLEGEGGTDMRKAERRPKWLLRATAAVPAGNPDVQRGHCGLTAASPSVQ